MFTVEMIGSLYHILKTLYTFTYGSIYESSYYAKYISSFFIFSLYHSSVSHNN